MKFCKNYMIRTLIILLAFFLIFDFLQIAAYADVYVSSTDPVIKRLEEQKRAEEKAAASFTYYDTPTRSCFTIPGGWKKVALNEDNKIFQVGFECEEDAPFAMILYGSFDVWSSLSKREQKQVSRTSCDLSVVTPEDIAEAAGVDVSDVKKLYFGSSNGNVYPYFQVKTISTEELSGIEVSAPITFLFTINNGRSYCFAIAGNYSSSQYSDLDAIIDSMYYGTPLNEEPTYTNENIFSLPEGVANFVLSLLITILIYSIPIIIYRYAIKRKPISKKDAKLATIIYAFVGFIVMSIISYLIDGTVASGGGILLWSFVNYKMLTSGKDKTPHSSDSISNEVESEITPTQTAEESSCVSIEAPINHQVITSKEYPPTIHPTQPSTTEQRFCHKCGTAALDDGIFCHKCGTKIMRE